MQYLQGSQAVSDLSDNAASPKPQKTTPRWRRWAAEVLLFIVIVAGVQLWQTRNAPRGPAPEFAGHLVDGQPFDLAAWRAAHAGRPVLLYFWAEWCPICKTTAGNVTNVSADWPVTSIAIQSGTAEQVAGVMAAKGYRWPTLPDPAAGSVCGNSVWPAPRRSSSSTRPATSVSSRSATPANSACACACGGRAGGLHENAVSGAGAGTCHPGFRAAREHSGSRWRRRHRPRSGQPASADRAPGRTIFGCGQGQRALVRAVRHSARHGTREKRKSAFFPGRPRQSGMWPCAARLIPSSV